MKIRSTKAILVVDVSPLWELQYTGISNVVHELARRFVGDRHYFDVWFTVFGKRVSTAVIEECVHCKSGEALHRAFRSGDGVSELKTDSRRRVDGRTTIGLFTNTKPAFKVFCADSQIFYDFSPLLTPECHTTDTVNHHTTGITNQVDSSSLMFCISNSTARDLIWAFGCPEEKVVVALLGNNVNLEYSEHAQAAIHGRCVEKYFLILGTIEPRKNISLVFKWIESNPGLLSKYRFVFAGRNGWGESFDDLTQRFNVAQYVADGRIVHLGFVDEWLKATLLVGAAAVIYPSLFEGFGLPVLEAMALGTPVISSCSTSLPEVLGDYGYYFDPYSVESLQAALDQFELDVTKGRLPHIIMAARDRANGFTYDKTYDVINSALYQLSQSLALDANDATI